MREQISTWHIRAQRRRDVRRAWNWLAFLVGAAVVAVAAANAKSAEPAVVHDALDEVNAARRARGLRPFVRDDGLTRAAKGCAKFRAERLIEGHYRDFDALPKGTTAAAAGCGAGRDHWGWLSCCAYENWKYAGAAWCRGRDGQRYCHLFVR